MDKSKKWSDLNKGEKVVGLIIIAVVAIFAITFLIAVAGAMSNQGDSSAPVAKEQAVETKTEPNELSVVDKVNKAFADMGDDYKNTLASTGTGGLQGEIVSVEPYSKDGIKVNISTNFRDGGDGEDGGQTIARKILVNLCFDVKELGSVYVSSTTSGLDSGSAYRSDIPACKQ